MSRLFTFVLSLGLLAGVVTHTPVERFTTSGLDPHLNHIAVIGDSYTTGTDEGGLGPKGWSSLAWSELAHRGVQLNADVVAEGGAGYVARGNRGSIFGDLTARAVKPDDTLVVFFGSRNDKDLDPAAITMMSHNAFTLAQHLAPSAKLLVVGPPWVSADVPPSILGIRDILKSQAHDVGAVFFDPIEDGWFFDRPDLIARDGIHPTDAGHAYMADRLAPLISRQLPRAL